MESIANNKLSTMENINGDVKLSFWKKLYWLYKCHINNKFPMLNIDPRIIIKDLRFEDVRKEDVSNDEAALTVSPVRYICDAFWSAFDFSALCTNGPIKALEVGCGTGIYGVKLKQILGNNLRLYRGVDIEENKSWKDARKENLFEFYVDGAENVHKYLDGINFIFTQSAIEHFEFDLLFINHLQEYVRKTKQPIWMIHLMPSAECLYTFLWHGYRQYTLSSISKITRLFPNNSEIVLYQLGNSFINRLHRLYVTLPNLFFRVGLQKILKNKYINSLVSAMRKDKSTLGSKANVSFYALVIKSN